MSIFYAIPGICKLPVSSCLTKGTDETENNTADESIVHLGKT